MATAAATRTSRPPNHDRLQLIKQAAADRWQEILARLGGIEPEILDGKHHPCPKCGGADRFRLIDAEAGALFCNQCFDKGNGDGIAALRWLCGWDFQTATEAIADYLGIGSNGDVCIGQRRIVATYDYRDAAGELVFQVVRFDPKDFRQRKPKLGGGWDWKVKGLPKLVYRSPDLLQADPEQWVFVPEGEKDVDNLFRVGLTATCNAMGAGKWRSEHAEQLVGRRVCVTSDNDDTGRDHAIDVGSSLVGKAASVKVIELPGLPEKGDVSDWLAAGGTAEELLRLAEEAPEWELETGERREEYTASEPPPEYDIPVPQDDPTHEDEAKETRIEYRRYSCAELADAEFHTEYLIDRTLVAGQPCIIAGGKKSLKTTIIIDMGLSLAMASPFLGKLAVPRAVTTGIMTGESGMATIQETARRVALAKGFNLRDVGSKLIFSDDIPQIGHLHHIDAMEAFITGNELELLVIDPTYLAMPGADAGNLFIQGELLRNVTSLCQRVGCALILVHHCRKNKQFQYDPPELEDIAWAGFQEWARQWVLVGRREPYTPGTGEHRLWLNVGGSAGHSGMWALDVSEGVYPSRFWDVKMLTAEEAFLTAKRQKESAKSESKQEQLREDRLAIFNYMQNMEEPDSMTSIRNEVGIGKERFRQAWVSLKDDGNIEAAGEVFKANNQKYQGWKISDAATAL